MLEDLLSELEPEPLELELEESLEPLRDSVSSLKHSFIFFSLNVKFLLS